MRMSRHDGRRGRLEKEAPLSRTLEVMPKEQTMCMLSEKLRIYYPSRISVSPALSTASPYSAFGNIQNLL